MLALGDIVLAEKGKVCCLTFWFELHGLLDARLEASVGTLWGKIPALGSVLWVRGLAPQA